MNVYGRLWRPDTLAGAVSRLADHAGADVALAGLWRHLTATLGATDAARLVAAAARDRGQDPTLIVDAAVQAAVFHG